MKTYIFKLSDLTILFGLIARILFSHIATSPPPASASVVNPLRMQGAGPGYAPLINERATELEYEARYALYELGAAQVSYAGSTSSGMSPTADSTWSKTPLGPS